MLQLTEPDPYAGMPLSALVDAVLGFRDAHNVMVEHARPFGASDQFVRNDDPWTFKFSCSWALDESSIVEAFQTVCSLSFAENSLKLLDCTEERLDFGCGHYVTDPRRKRTYVVAVRIEKPPTSLDILHAVSRLRRSACS